MNSSPERGLKILSKALKISHLATVGGFAKYKNIINCHNPNDNTTQPQHNLNTIVGLNTKRTVHTTPPHHHHPTIQTQQQPSCASD